MRVGFCSQPSFIGALEQDQRHAVVNLRDQVVRRHGDDREGANPFARVRMAPVLPQPALSFAVIPILAGLHHQYVRI